MHFKKFEIKHWDILNNATWRRIQEYYYPHKLWINVNNSSKTFITAILESIAAN